MKKRCGGCRYYDNTELGGVCRRYPPQFLSSVVHLLVKDADEQYQAENKEKMDDTSYEDAVYSNAECPGAWRQPSVDEDDWCGEWKEKSGGDN